MTAVIWCYWSIWRWPGRAGHNLGFQARFNLPQMLHDIFQASILFIALRHIDQDILCCICYSLLGTLCVALSAVCYLICKSENLLKRLTMESKYALDCNLSTSTWCLQTQSILPLTRCMVSDSHMIKAWHDRHDKNMPPQQLNRGSFGQITAEALNTLCSVTADWLLTNPDWISHPGETRYSSCRHHFYCPSWSSALALACHRYHKLHRWAQVNKDQSHVHGIWFKHLIIPAIASICNLCITGIWQIYSKLLHWAKANELRLTMQMNKLEVHGEGRSFCLWPALFLVNLWYLRSFQDCNAKVGSHSKLCLMHQRSNSRVCELQQNCASEDNRAWPSLWNSFYASSELLTLHINDHYSVMRHAKNLCEHSRIEPGWVHSDGSGTSWRPHVCILSYEFQDSRYSQTQTFADCPRCRPSDDDSLSKEMSSLWLYKVSIFVLLKSMWGSPSSWPPRSKMEILKRLLMIENSRVGDCVHAENLSKWNWCCAF